MATLNKVVIQAEDGCVDSVGGVSFVREPTRVDPNAVYTIKVFDGVSTLELQLSGVELGNFMRTVKGL